MVLLGFTVASAGFSVFSDVQYLSELTRQHVRLWREIERTTTYVLGVREERPLPPSVAEKMQSKVTALLVEEQKINAEIKAITTQTRSLRRFLFSKDQEEGAIADADVDRDVRLHIERFTRSVPAVISTGFSAWNSVSDLKLRSGVALKPLIAREDALAGIKQRVINATWITFFTIVAIVLSSIWLFWVFFLSPSLYRLQEAVSSGVRQTRIINRARRQLQEREQFLRVLLDNTPGMIASLDGSFRYTSANRAYLNAVGTANPDDIIGRTVEDVLGAAWWSRIKEHLDAAMRGQPVKFETQVEIFAQQRYVQATYVPQIDHNGKPAGVVALVLDVHEQRVAREALRSSEANLRATLNSIREAVVATDECGRIAHMNPTAETMTGLPFELAAQRQLEDVVDIRDMGSRRRIASLASWKTPNEPEAGLGSLLVSRDGDEYEVFLTVSPIFSATMENLGTVVVMRDITSENVLRKQLSQHERLTSLGQLAGGIAHDFNNLLASMRGAAEVLDVKEQPRLSDEGTALVKAIITTCDRAADLTERLTRLGRQSNREFSVVSMRQVVDEVVEIVGRTIGRAIIIDVQFNAHDAHVLGDLSSLENALLNLCINGTQAMPKGGVLTIATRNVELTPEDCQKSMFQLSPGLHIETSIIDTGVGISEKIIDKIFDPFFTTKGVGEGSGIGLAMAYGVVTDHSGALEVSSELHKGATFRMLLPSTVPGDLTADEKAIGLVAADEALIAAGNTILLVEDERILREVLEAMLEALGQKVIAARDGAEAIEIYGRHNDHIDLVLLDLNMPKVAGKEAIAELRKINPNCRAVFMTGFADPNLFNTELMKDAIVLRKPFSQDDLSRALSQTAQKVLVRDP